MSPLFPLIQSDLDLNGPTLSFTTQPVDTSYSAASGIATFIGIATATFPETQTERDTNTGTVTYQWHLDGNELSDGTTTTTGTSTGKITYTTLSTGSASPQQGVSREIDFSQVSSFDFGSSAFVSSDLSFVADSDITVKLYLVGAGGGASQADGILGGAGGLSEGTFTFLKDQKYVMRMGGNGAGIAHRKRTGGGDGTGSNGEFGGGGGYTGLFINDYTHTNAIIMAGGGGGGASDPATGGVGGGLDGGNSSNVGKGGSGGTQSAGGSGGSGAGNAGQSGSQLLGGDGAGGGGGGYYGGGGGNGSFVSFDDGAGGGGSGFVHPTLITDGVLTQGEGTVSNGVNGSFRIEVISTTKTKTIAGSATTTLTLSGFTDPLDTNGVVFVQAGYDPNDLTPNAINEPLNSNIVNITVFPTISITTQPVDTTVVEDIETSFSIVASASDGTDSSLSYQWYLNNSAISGATSSTLSITRPNSGLDKVYCEVSHPTAQPGTATSNEVNLDVSDSRIFIRWEKFGNATRTEQGNRNLATSGPFTARADANREYRTIQMWSPEKDIDVKITMGGAAGSARNSNRGGEGGISVFKMTLKQNTEYTVKLGVNSFQGGGPRGGNNGGGGLAVIYEKARVLAVCGGGGGAGGNGRGGDGGGLNVAGESAPGGGGFGGPFVGVDTLPTTGATQAGRTGVNDFDNNSSGSGRLSGCTIGKYWREQGKLPCEDLGNNVEFLTANGATYSPTTGIERGYKVGQGHRNNGGAGSGNGAGGGAGARGGQGSGQQGGGGASGYYASQVELLSSSTLPNGTQLGGNADVAFISVEAYSVNDDQEPLIPPASGTALAAERTVTWTVTRSTTETVVGVFSLTSGSGPNQIGFGPNGETKTSQISSGAVYTLTGTSADKKNLNGNTLTLTDDDSNPGAISITSDIGRFTSNERWEANW